MVQLAVPDCIHDEHVGFLGRRDEDADHVLIADFVPIDVDDLEGVLRQIVVMRQGFELKGQN